MLHHPQRGFCARVHAEFRKNAAQVRIDGAHAEDQCLGDVFIGETLSQQAQDIHFSIGERLDRSRLDRFTTSQHQQRSRRNRRRQDQLAPCIDALLQVFPQRREEAHVEAELSVAEIERLVAAFATAAARARAAGFHAVQLHAAHGYLINQFLSPLTNHRTDDYGGSIANRCRFLLEVSRSVRKAVGSDFPVLVKLNGDDFLPGGLSSDDALVAAKALDEEGIDAIEVSGGTPASGDCTPVRQKIEDRQQEAYNLPLAARIKGAVSCPVMVVGGLRSYEVIAGIIRREEADYVALARPLIREPHLPLRWEAGDESRARCISCNGCFKPGLREKGIYCVVDKIERESHDLSL